MGGAGLELAHLLGDGDDDLLHDLLRLGVREAGFERGAVNEFPVSVKELAPTVLVVPVLEPAQQAPARGQEFVCIRFHGKRWPGRAARPGVPHGQLFELLHHFNSGVARQGQPTFRATEDIHLKIYTFGKGVF